MAIIKPNNNTISAITALPTGLGGKVLQVVQDTLTSAFETTRETKKASGKQKLKDLGLDDDEIQALIGV